jgi:hypothetical protein
MLLGGIMPPPSPEIALRAIKVPMLGAKAEAKTLTVSNVSPINATGRLPNESDKGPTETTEKPHAANVTVLSCPATETEVLKSAAMATSSGANIKEVLMVAKSPKPTETMKRV